MSTNQFDPELQAIEAELLAGSPVETQETDLPVIVNIPKRKRSLLTQVCRQYARLDNRYQQPFEMAKSRLNLLVNGTCAAYSLGRKFPKRCIVGSVILLTMSVSLPLLFSSTKQIASDPVETYPIENTSSPGVYVNVSGTSESTGWSTYSAGNTDFNSEEEWPTFCCSAGISYRD